MAAFAPEGAVAEDRNHRAGPDASAGALARWARAAVGLGVDPPLRAPRPPRIEPIRRPWLAAFWHARVAVRAGMALDDFLRSRLARYLAGLPVPSGRLPLEVDVEDGRIAVRPAAAGAAPAPDAAADSWLAPLVALEGPAVRQEVSELEVRLAMLDGEIDAGRRRAEDLARRFAADVATGIVAGPPAVNATAEQLGRPPVRSAAPLALALAFAAAALGAETWQVAQPLLRAAGLEPSDLGAEALHRPAELAFAAVFALGVAAGLFALAQGGLSAAGALFGGEGDAQRRRWLAAAALGAASMATLVAAAVTSLPQGGEARAPAAALVLLLVAVPLAAALVVRAARLPEERRAEELAAALAWDRERARALAERGRRLEELAWADEEARDLERQRDAARRRLREVNGRAMRAARLAAEAARAERAVLSRLAHTLVGALEIDRYEFVRQASARGAVELLSPRRRKAGEPRPAFDEATAPVAAPAEAGRLAS